MTEQAVAAPRRRWRRHAKRTGLGLAIAIAALLAVVLVVANTKDGAVSILQWLVYEKLGRSPNDFAPASPPRDSVRPDGIRVRANVSYGSKYPNSFLDIWYAGSGDPARRPTVIYLHGGGFFMGSKDSGDPVANDGNTQALDGTVSELAKAGFNVANVDYALAPTYRYPTPLIQLNQGLAFLTTRADELGLDMTRVFIMGGSAGAQLSAQYGLLVSDPGYAKALGIIPSIKPGSVRGLVLFSAPLRLSTRDWRFNAMMWSYLDTKDLDASRQVRDTDIISHLNARYPPTYLTDGNQADTFPEHAKAMAAGLQRQGVDYVFNYYDPSEARLDHGYTGRLDTKWGRDNLEKAISFMNSRSRAARDPQ